MPEGARLRERCSCPGSASVEAAQSAIIRGGISTFPDPNLLFTALSHSRQITYYYHLTIGRAML